MNEQKTTSKARTIGVLTAAELGDATASLRKALVSQSGPTKEVVAYLESFAVFKRNGAKAHGAFKCLSANNIALLNAQRGSRNLIGLYAGTKQWQAMSRILLDDAKPLTIWVPTIKKANEKDSETPTVEDSKVSVRFTTAPVYDWADTISTDPDFIEPQWQAPLLTGDQACLDLLIKTSSIPVIFKDFGGRTENGHTDGITIVVDTGSVNNPRNLGNQISTLAHELVHVELDHNTLISNAPSNMMESVRAMIEAEAGLGQYLLLKALGLDESVGNEITEQAASYINSWIGADGAEIAGHKGRMRLLNQRLDTASGAVDQIINRLLTPPHSQISI